MAKKFITDKELAFISKINKELIQNYVSQEVIYYAISEEHTVSHGLYKESVNKVWFSPIRINARVSFDNPGVDTTNMSLDSKFTLEVMFHNDELSDRNTRPREGDFIEFGQIIFEITSVTQPQLVFGQANNKIMTKCYCVPSREGQMQIHGINAQFIDNTHLIENRICEAEAEFAGSVLTTDPWVLEGSLTANANVSVVYLYNSDYWPVTGSLRLNDPQGTSVQAAQYTLLADLDFRTPNSLNLSGMFTNADSWWDMQESSGTTLADQVGSNDLTVSGALVGQTVQGVYYNDSYTGKRATEMLSANHGASLASASVFDLDDATSLAVACVFRCVPGATGYLFSKYTASVGGWLCHIDGNGRINGRVYDGSAFASVATTKRFDDGAVHYAILVVNEATKELELHTDLEVRPFVSFSSLGSKGSTSVASFVGGVTARVGCQHLGAAAWVGVAAESAADDVAAAWTHAKDPSGLLTTVTRSGTIALPTSPSTFAYFGTDQLPIGYSSLLNGGAGGLGLYCNSALTNHLEYSEDLTAWTPTTSTIDTPATDNPAGFRNTQAITAAATDSNHYLISPSSLAGNKTYTLLVWAKRNGASDVTGKIRLFQTGVSGTNYLFTATDTWQRIAVQHTWSAVAATAVASLWIDNSGDSICYFGAQVLEGAWTAENAPYIPTIGTVATLTVPDYEATFAAETVALVAAGEMEVVSAGVVNLSAAASGYLVDLWGTSNRNRRALLHASNGRTPRSYVFDPAEVLVNNTDLSIRDTDGQESTDVVQWSGAAGITGGYSHRHVYNTAEDTYSPTFDVDASTYQITKLQIGNYGQAPDSSFAPDKYVSRIRLWNEPMSGI